MTIPDVTYKPLILMDHTRLVSDIKFAPDGSLRLLSGSHDGSLKIWNIKDDGNMFPTLKGRDIDGNQYRMIHGVAWSPDCHLVCGVGTSSGVGKQLSFIFLAMQINMQLIFMGFFQIGCWQPFWISNS